MLVHNISLYPSKRKVATSRDQTLNESRLSPVYSTEYHRYLYERITTDGDGKVLGAENYYVVSRDITQDTSQATLNLRWVLSETLMKHDLDIFITVSDQGPQYL